MTIWILWAVVLWLVYRDFQRSAWQKIIAEGVTTRLIRLERRTGLIGKDGLPRRDEREDYPGDPEQSGTGRARWVSER